MQKIVHSQPTYEAASSITAARQLSVVTPSSFTATKLKIQGMVRVVLGFVNPCDRRTRLADARVLVSEGETVLKLQARCLTFTLGCYDLSRVAILLTFDSRLTL